KEYAAPLAMARASSQIIRGPDGNLWFAEFGAIGIFNPSTASLVKEAPLPGGSHEVPFDLTIGPDGNIWYGVGVLNADKTAYLSFAIGTVSTSLQSVSSPEIALSNSTEPYSITAGPDGKIWYVVAGNATTAGTINVIDPVTRMLTQTLTIPTSHVP